MATRPKDTWFFKLSLVLVTVALLAVLAELSLRAMGFSPAKPPAPRPALIPVTTADAELGWRNRSSSFSAPISRTVPELVQYSMLADGSRTTGWTGASAAKNILLFGCSFTFGWGVSDNETFAWKLQELVPKWHFHNFGVVAYGTYQSLLLMKRVIQSAHAGEDTVVYGLIENHEVRNSVPLLWLYLVEQIGFSDSVAIPRAALGPDNSLEYFPPLSVPRWPLREQSALVALAERAQVNARFSARDDGRRLTEQLILEMKRLAEEKHLRFVTAILAVSPTRSESYAKFFQSHDIEYVDCSPSDFESETFHLAHDVHPNASAHTKYAQCIERELRARALP